MITRGMGRGNGSRHDNTSVCDVGHTLDADEAERAINVICQDGQHLQQVNRKVGFRGMLCLVDWMESAINKNYGHCLAAKVDNIRVCRQ
jgi:hypothetical protein